MADGENSNSAVQTWRPGTLSVAHVALTFSVLVCAAMSVLTLAL